MNCCLIDPTSIVMSEVVQPMEVQVDAVPVVTPKEAVPAEKKASGKQKAQISSKDYEEITDLLKIRLKQLEDANPDEFQGCQWKELTEWFIVEVTDSICLITLLITFS
jgi:hypothetical protein